MGAVAMLTGKEITHSKWIRPSVLETGMSRGSSQQMPDMSFSST